MRVVPPNTKFSREIPRNAKLPAQGPGETCIQIGCFWMACLLGFFFDCTGNSVFPNQFAFVWFLGVPPYLFLFCNFSFSPSFRNPHFLFFVLPPPSSPRVLLNAEQVIIKQSPFFFFFHCFRLCPSAFFFLPFKPPPSHFFLRSRLFGGDHLYLSDCHPTSPSLLSSLPIPSLRLLRCVGAQLRPVPTLSCYSFGAVF